MSPANEDNRILGGKVWGRREGMIWWNPAVLGVPRCFPWYGVMSLLIIFLTDSFVGVDTNSRLSNPDINSACKWKQQACRCLTQQDAGVVSVAAVNGSLSETAQINVELSTLAAWGKSMPRKPPSSESGTVPPHCATQFTFDGRCNLGALVLSSMDQINTLSSDGLQISVCRM